MFDDKRNDFTIVPAHGRPSRYHVNRNEWDESRSCYLGAFRVFSNVSLDEAKQYVMDECVASARMG